MKKWLVGWACVGMWAATAMGQATLPASWSGPWTNANLPVGWTNFGLGTDYSGTSGGYDSTGGGPARFDGANDALTINFDSAPGDVTYWPRLNVGSGSWTTNIFKLQESADGTSWADVTVYDAGNPIPTAVPTGPYTSSPSATARYLRFFYEQKGNGNVGIDGVTIAAGSGVVATNVRFFASGATMDEDQGIYEVAIYKTLPEGDVSGEVALSGTATEGAGADYTVDTTNFTMNGTTTSAVVTVTINDDEEAEAMESIVLTLANVVGGTVVSPDVFSINVNPSDIPTHAIAIVTNAPENGTVTTTPAGTAEEGATVTIASTPAEGYRVASIAVVDGASNPVTVTGNTFVMPTSDATVTVTFEVYDAPDAVIDFETVTGFGGYAPGTSTVSGVSIVHSGAMRGTTAGSDRFNGAASARVRYLSTNAGFFATASAFAQPITKLNFWYADYGSDNTTTFKVQTSPNGTDWTDVGEAAYDPASTALVEAVIESIPAGMTYFQFVTLGGEADRVSIDDIGLWFGSAIFGVTFDQTEGFVIEEGTTDVIVATAANGSEPYAYSWTSTLGEGYRTADGSQFTILATAPVGDYSATVVATDNTAASVTNTINFSVKAPHAIAITPPVNGTVSTAPADEAIVGTTVTITATPDANYLVGSIVVLDDTATPVAVVGNDFVMPDAPVTVTVTFVYDVATLPISEVHTNTTDWTLLPGWSGVSMSTYSDGDMSFNGSNDALTVNFDAQPGELSFDLQGRASAVGTPPAQFLVEESADGSSWTQVASIDDTQLSTTNTAFGPYGLQAASRYVRWTYVIKYAYNIGLNNVSITSGGAPVFTVSVDKTNGFTVAQGASDAITATPANGTEPIAYGWASTLNPADYTAAGNVFTIGATAPAGDYSATVYATNSDLATAQATVSFSVVGGGGEIWTIGDGSQGSTMFYATSNQNIIIILPTNYNLTAVYGTDPSAVGLNNLGQGTGSPLTPGVDYTWTPATRTVSVLSGVTNRRVLRIGASSP